MSFGKACSKFGWKKSPTTWPPKQRWRSTLRRRHSSNRYKPMASMRKLERDFAYADRSAVAGLLAQLTDEDVMTRIGLEARLEELQQTIAGLADEVETPTASAMLFFGGRPVLGSRGIESEFAGSAVTKFQDIVAKMLAHEAGGLGQRGIVPNKSAATLHITNIVRGSFGFLLEEIEAQPGLFDTQLKTAVDDATRLLDAFGEPDEEEFRSAVETIDQRLLGTAREFFELMRQNGATLRLVAGDLDRSFGAEAVTRAAERATSTTVEDAEEAARGSARRDAAGSASVRVPNGRVRNHSWAGGSGAAGRSTGSIEQRPGQCGRPGGYARAANFARCRRRAGKLHLGQSRKDRRGPGEPGLSAPMYLAAPEPEMRAASRLHPH